MAYTAPALTALLGTLGLILFLRPAAALFGLIDRPDSRKRHAGEVPLVGGIAMFGGIVAGVLVATGADRFSLELVIASTLLVAVGTFDDRRNLHYAIRLTAQLGAALIMIIGANLVVADVGAPFGTGIVHLGPLAITASLLITLTVINAFNFLDGVDGLAGSVALIALIAVAFAGGWAAPSTVMAVVAIAAIIGFLFFNFPRVGENRVRTFMGDAGSTFLGLLVVWLTIEISQGEARHISPVIGLWFALVPIADLFQCFVRRIARKQSPTTAGLDHSHHILLGAGMNSRQVVAVLTGLAALYAGFGLVGAKAGVPDFAMFTFWLALGAAQFWIVKSIAKWFIARSGSAKPESIETTNGKQTSDNSIKPSNTVIKI
ncbi:MAG: undecaprenyl/decaprenyl-phosphate alpha-N-acetylglucosaminyl 1-phosphate transferase [Woeseia sp.]|nr:undecaprenyl/decaprenyl-phosphate alpha-N-acetylglucosaminyl 1-phosphate transferase [Woeseia sp.]